MNQFYRYVFSVLVHMTNSMRSAIPYDCPNEQGLRDALNAFEDQIAIARDLSRKIK